MNENAYTPGCLVKVGRRVYHHYAIVSDRMEHGKPMLISLSYRTGTVAEEPWDTVVCGGEVKPSRLRSHLAPARVLERARAELGRQRYNLFTNNCEHFARDMLGLPRSSRQIETAASAGVSVALIALRLARGNPIIAVASTAAGILLGSRFSAK